MPMMIEGAKARFFGLDGLPLAGGKVHIYAAGTTTPITSYNSRDLTVPNTWPVVLDSAGKADIYLEGPARFRILDRFDVLIEETDWIRGDDQDTIKFALATTGAVSRNIRDKITEIRSVRDMGAKGDGLTDDTTAFQKCADLGGFWQVPPGIYKLTSVTMDKDMTWYCHKGSLFLRAPNTDVVQGSSWSINTIGGQTVYGVAANTAMFATASDGLTVRFLGLPVFDGNKAAQPMVGPTGKFAEPNGWAFAHSVRDLNSTTDVYIHFENAIFQNGTAGYIRVRGCNNTRNHKTRLILNDCRMFDTIAGTGKDDPNTPTALGWSSDYIQILDYVLLTTYNLEGEYREYNGATPTGKYAPVLCRATFYGPDPLTSGECSVAFYGKTRTFGMGRKNARFDGSATSGNNGIGVIDCYGNAESLHVQDFHGQKNESNSIRAKANIKRFTVLSATFDQCYTGINVSPAPGGANEAIVRIDSVVSYAGVVPIISVVGNSPSDKVASCTIGSVFAGASPVNVEGNALDAVVHVRNCSRLAIQSCGIYGAPGRALIINEVLRADVGALVVNGTGAQLGTMPTLSGEAVMLYGGGSIVIRSFDIRNVSGAAAINLANDPAFVTVRDGYISGCQDYAIFGNATDTRFFIENVKFDTISGASRGVYAGGASCSVYDCYSGAAVTTPLYPKAGTRVIASGNSWEPLDAVATTADDPARNGQMTVNLLSDTSLQIRVKGSDGVIRSTTLALS